MTKIERKQKEFERQIQKNEEEPNQKYENELTKHKAITEDHKNAILASLKTHEIEQIQNEMKEMKNLLFDEGIMHFLSEKTNGNIHDNETIEITSNSIRESL